MESLIFLVEKKDGRIKARTCANGSIQCEWINKEDAASPTAAIELIFLTLVIDAKEGRDVMTADVPNAFVQTPMPEVKEGDKRVTMKIGRALVDMLVEMAPSTYKDYVIYERGQKVL